MKDVMETQAEKLRELLDQAKAAYCQCHGSQVWVHNPFACKGTTDVHDIYRDAAKLEDALTAVGVHLLECLALPSDLVRGGTDHALGSAYCDCYYADMIGRFEKVLRLFREKKWDELHQEGCLEDGEYEELNRHREAATLPLSSLDDDDSVDECLEKLYSAIRL